jgi:hypothetical protein
MNIETMEIALTQDGKGYSLNIKSERIKICATFNGNGVPVTCGPCGTLEDVRETVKGLALVASVGTALAHTPALTKPIPLYSFEVNHKKGCTSSAIHKESIPFAVTGSDHAQTRAAALELARPGTLAAVPLGL